MALTEPVNSEGPVRPLYEVLCARVIRASPISPEFWFSACLSFSRLSVPAVEDAGCVCSTVCTDFMEAR